MATQVGTAVIKLSFDGKDINAQLSQVGSNAEKEGKKAGVNFGSALTVAAGNLIAKGIGKIASEITNGLDKAIKRSDTINNFPKLMRNFGVSTEESARVINSLKDNLDGLPTSLDTATSGVRDLFLVTKDLSKAENLFYAINDAALVFANGSEDAMDRFIYAYRQALSAGKVQAQDFNQMNEAIPGVMDKVAESMGITFGQLKEGLSNGSISMDEFNSALLKLDTEGTSSMTSLQNAAKTATGGIGTAVRNLGNRIAAGWASIIDAIGSDPIADFVNKIGIAFRQAGAEIGSFINFMQQATPASDALKASLAGLTTVLGTLVTFNIAERIGNTISRVGGLAKAISTLFAGHPILAIIVGIVAALALFFTQTETGRGIIQKFGEVLNKVFESLGSVFSFVGNVFNSLGPVFESVGKIFQKVGEIIGVVFDYIGQGISQFADAFNMLFPTVQPLLEALGNLFMTVGGAVLQILQALLPLIKSIGQLLATLMPPILQILGAVFGVIQQLIPPLMQILMAVGQIITTLVSALIPPLSLIIQIIGQVIQTIASALMPIINALMPIIQFILQVVITGINIVIAVITEIINAVSNVINFIMPIITGVINVITGIIQGLGNFIGGIFNFIGNIVSGVFSGIGNFIGGIINGVRNVFQGLANFIGGIVNNIRGFFDGLGNGIRSVFEGIRTVVSNIFSAIGAIIKAPINGIINGINGVIGMINSIQIPDWVPIIGGAHANIGYIPTLAEGGVTTGATLSIIGEAGKEAVIPLERNQDNWAGLLASTLAEEMHTQGVSGTGITVYMTNEINNDMDAEDIGRKLMTSIRRAA